MKTSFDPILAPVITQKLAEGDKPAVARQVRQVGFWIIAAQTGIALALGIPGAAVMGLVGPQFAAGAGALGFLLAAEAVAATAAVSESALVYVARHRNLLISLLMIAAQALFTVAIIVGLDVLGWPEDPMRRQAFQAGGRGARADARARLGLRAEGALARRAPRRAGAGLALVADLGGGGGGSGRRRLRGAAAPLRMEQAGLGTPLILLTFGYVVWRRGFTKEDRALFRRHGPEEPTLPPPGTSAP